MERSSLRLIVHFLYAFDVLTELNLRSQDLRIYVNPEEPASSSKRFRMRLFKSKFDPRFFQIAFLSSFLLYGLCFLHWSHDSRFYTLFIVSCLLCQWTGDSMIRRNPIRLGDEWTGWRSALITGLGLCFLLKTNDWYVCVLAGSLSILSKYIIRYQGKHVFNPSAFGIAATILLSGKAWLSPAQWGNQILVVFLACCLGFIVVTRVQKLDVTLAFLLTFAGLFFTRQVLYQHWPVDYFLKSISTGSLLIFSFFMISDPKTSPNHPVVRVVWAIIIGALAFYLSAIEWMNNTPIWTLVIMSPFVPMLDRLFRYQPFHWNPVRTNSNYQQTKSIV
jgi:NQR2, RnfD, RnfE family